MGWGVGDQWGVGWYSELWWDVVCVWEAALVGLWVVVRGGTHTDTTLVGGKLWGRRGHLGGWGWFF